MGHFARECHSARVGIIFLSEITEAEDTGEEADLALRSLKGPRRAREDTAVTAVTEAGVVHRRQRKVVK